MAHDPPEDQTWVALTWKWLPPVGRLDMPAVPRLPSVTVPALCVGSSVSLRLTGTSQQSHSSESAPSDLEFP